jgi:hypothetical protein
MQRSSHFQNKSIWRLVRVAVGLTVTTMVSIRISASPALTFEAVRIPLCDIAARASVCVAMTFLSTALVKVHVGAVQVITKDIGGIMPKQISWRTRRRAASALNTCTRIQVTFI